MDVSGRCNKVAVGVKVLKVPLEFLARKIWVDGDYIHTDRKNWKWNNSDENDQEFEFRKDQMELESETD